MRPSSKPEDPTDSQGCRKKALDLLARREHSRVELSAKLEARGFAQACVEITLDQLVAERLLDERRFAETFVRARVARGQGPLRILAELRARGLADALADEAVRHSGRDWAELARQVRAKKFGFDAPTDFEQQARQRRFLESRGFGFEHIRGALDLAADSD